jgi:hypothetical protein
MKDSDNCDWLPISILAIWIGLAMIGNGMKENEIARLKKQAVEHNYAEYNHTNGVWQWKQ